MKSLLGTAFILHLFLFGKGQQVIDVTKDNIQLNRYATDVSSGMLFNANKFIELKSGSPFFKETFMKGRLSDAQDNIYASRSVRLNLLDNQVNFLDAGGQELIATANLTKIMLTDSTTGYTYVFILGSQFPGIDKELGKNWFQVLVNDNKASLIRQIKKTMLETRPYGSATVEQQINTNDFYWVRMNGNLIRVKKWDEVSSDLFKDKKDAITQYIHDHHLKGKTPEEYTELVKYYNSL